MNLLDGHALDDRADHADCQSCPLRPLACFATLGDEELGLIESLKQQELELEAGELLIAEGGRDTPLFTLLAGWAARFKTLDDGRRQIVNVLLPGDFIGLQQKMDDAASHGVVALTAVRLCRFARQTIWSLHSRAPSLGYDVTWLAAHEQRLLDDQLVTVGRRTALERVAALLLTLHQRAWPLHNPEDGEGLRIPLTQQQLADALGLSLIHTHRSLRELTRRKLMHWGSDRRLHLLDGPAMADLARMPWPVPRSHRPLI